MTKRTGVDKSLYYVAKEEIGKPWTYSAETKAKLAAEMQATVMPSPLPSEYDTAPSTNAGALRPKNTKHDLQQSNGRRSQCQGYKAEFKTGNARTLPKPAPDYAELAKKIRAIRGKKKQSKLRAKPCAAK